MESIYEDEEDPRKRWRVISFLVLLGAGLGLIVSFWFSHNNGKVISGRWLRMDTAINTSFEKNSEETPEIFKSLPPISIPNLLLSPSLSGSGHGHSGKYAAPVPLPAQVASGAPRQTAPAVPDADDSAEMDRLASEATAASIAASSVPPPDLAPPPPAAPAQPAVSETAKAATDVAPASATAPAASAAANPSVAAPAQDGNTEIAMAAAPTDSQAFFQLLSKHLTAANDKALAESLHAGDKQVIEIRFSIDRNGRVLRAAPAAPSGNAVLDQSAARIILNASPLPRPPPDLRGNQIELSFAVEVYR